IRIIGGKLKRWGLCLYFFNKEGRLMNDDILNHSDEYQIFFTVAINSGPLPDGALTGEGANILYQHIAEFCDDWEQFVRV
ncbi:MAG: hypothetical protein ACFNM6_09120, partial [Prevotella sp.]